MSSTDVTPAVSPVPLRTDIRSARALLLTTFRRTGAPVATPVWFVADGDRLLITTTPASGKVQRLRHTHRVIIAPCTQRGKPTGAAVEATARLLDAVETTAALRAIRRRYGLFDRLFSFINRLLGERDEIGIEITVPAP